MLHRRTIKGDTMGDDVCVCVYVCVMHTCLLSNYHYLTRSINISNRIVAR